MSIFKLAWRNIWRNQRRTGVTVAAMSFALLAMILYSGLVRGYLESMERNILDLELGEVQIFAEEYRDKPSLYTRIFHTDELLAQLNDAGFRASARCIAAGLAAGDEASSGVMFFGIDPHRDATVSEIYKQVIKGNWLDTDDRHGVVIGRKLAHTLNVTVGDEIVVLTQGADGSMANDLYTVRGILKGITELVDRAGIFMTMEGYRELTVLDEGVHQIIVRTPQDVELDGAMASINELAPDLDVESWRDLMPTIASMLDNVEGLMITMFLIVYIAIAIVILNAMLMAVFERIKEFGILKALGVGPGMVLRLIFVETTIQTVLALAIGCLLSIPGLLYLTRVGINLAEIGGISVYGLSWDPVWRASVTVNTYAGPVITFVLIVSVAVIYPALKAAFIRPVEAIHHN